MTALFRAELELCKVKPGEVLAVLSEGGARADYAATFLAAAQDLGALPFHVALPSRQAAGEERQTGKTPLADNRPVIDALKQVGILVDLVGLLFSREQNEMTDAGVRVLMVLEPPDVLRQMFPTEDQRRRVEFGARLIEDAKEMRITSDAGTDIRYGLSQYPVLTEYGYTDTPGRWDHWPSGFLLTQGNDEDVEGVVVLMPGDIINEFRSYVQSPVKLTIKRGRATAIEGRRPRRCLPPQLHRQLR
jgi:2,5-dihydroxypyridine 5,6-dioxygenase